MFAYNSQFLGIDPLNQDFTDNYFSEQMAGLFTHIGDELYYCKICDKTIKRLHHLRNHFRDQHATCEKPICPICNNTSKNLTSLRMHIIAMHKKK